MTRTDTATRDDAPDRAADGAGDDASAVRGVDHVVPSDADRYDCPYCGDVFARERPRDLHRGLAHPDHLGDAERAAYDDAAAAEADDLRRFRIVGLGLLVLLYFGFLFLYALSGLGGESADAASSLLLVVAAAPRCARRVRRADPTDGD
ncbi:DUF7410 domain-containing protein [Halobaculum sp. D14]|uniref:DUF7410 domain-containing protein n=1 Tax=Halobaculum sp. D14 TaxID=3421642 RepID=UPI003EB7D211